MAVEQVVVTIKGGVATVTKKPKDVRVIIDDQDVQDCDIYKKGLEIDD